MEKYDRLIENRIKHKIKREISIDNFQKDIPVKENIIDKWIKIITSIISIIAIAGTAVYAYNNMKFKNIDIQDISYALIQDVSSDSIKNAVDNGYIENLNMDYSYNNNIGCKIDSIIFSENDLSVTMNFDFSNNEIDKNKILAKIIIYDENKNIYCTYSPIKENQKEKRLYKKMGLDEKNKLANLISYSNIYESLDKVISQILITDPKTKFPKSETLFIKIYDIGYIENDKYIYLCKDVEWNFKINIPEKFYNSMIDFYKLETEIDSFSLNKLYITNTHAMMNCNFDDFSTDIQIVDENGKIYKSYSSERLENGSYNKNYSINRFDIKDKIFLRIIKGTDIQEIELKKI